MILEIDAGNSSVKWRIIDNGVALARGAVTHEPVTWAPMLGRAGGLTRVRVANVCGEELEQGLRDWVQQRTGLNIEVAVSEPSTAGVTNGYDKPQKLGVDRWLAVVAAWNTLASPSVVVDAGTAVTLDFIGACGVHLGGYIVPGEQMMYRALFSGTSGVRFEASSSYSRQPGRDTGEAVQHGCSLMIEAIVARSLSWLQSKEGEVTLVLTGGGAARLQSAFRENTRYIPDLVLDGLGYALP